MVTNSVSDSPLVSVVIAVRNEADAVVPCLDAIAAQTYPRVEVLVVDGESADGTAARLRTWSAVTGRVVTVLRNPRGDTPSSFNLGIRWARGSLILILGARARLAPDFLAEAVAALAHTGADAVGGVVRTRPGGETAIARAIALAQRSPFGVGDARYRYAAAAGEVDTINYGVYRREVFERIGLFDESLQWVEDDELNYRLRDSGGRLVLDPRMEVDYLARPSLGALWRQRFNWGQAKPRVARRLPRQMRLRHIIPAAFVLGLTFGLSVWPLGGFARLPLALIAGAYAAGSSVATVRLGHRQGWRPEFALVPLAFLTMHLAYGLGTLAGAATALRPPEADGVSRLASQHG